MIRNLLSKGLRLRNKTFSTSGLEASTTELVTLDNFREIQLNRLQELKPEQFDEAALFHLIGDFLVKPSKPDFVVAEQLINSLLFKMPHIDPKGELTSLFIIQLLEAGASEKAAHFLIRVLDPKSSLKASPFVMEYIWESIIKHRAGDAGQSLYAFFKNNLEVIQSLGFPFDADFKERLILELFLPCRNMNMVESILSESVSNNAIGLSSNTLFEIFKVFVEPEAEDVYHDTEAFSEATVMPRFHNLIHHLEHWKSLGIPIKGDAMSQALSFLFQSFLPSESMLQNLESII